MTSPDTSAGATAAPAEAGGQQDGRSRVRNELLSAVVVTAAGLLLLVATLMIPAPARPSPGMGPTVMPMIISLALVAAGVMLALTARRRGDEGLEDFVLGEDDAEFRDLLEEDEPVPMRGFLVVLGLLVLYALTFIPLGFILSTTLFLGLITTYVAPRRWVRNWLFGVLLAVAVYYLFTQVLAVELPAGILG